MKKELNLEQLNLIAREIASLQLQHPKANVAYDTRDRRINITYPLPEDMWEIQSIKFTDPNNYCCYNRSFDKDHKCQKSPNTSK